MCLSDALDDGQAKANTGMIVVHTCGPLLKRFNQHCECL